MAGREEEVEGTGGIITIRGSRISLALEGKKGSKLITEIIVKIVLEIHGNRIKINKEKKDVWYICMDLGHIGWKEQLYYLLW